MLSVRQVSEALENLGRRQDAMVKTKLAQTTKPHELTVALWKTET